MRVAFAAPFALLLSSASVAVLANPGSGGGMTSPSISAPDFDAAAEYRTGIEALKANRFSDARKSFNRVLGAIPNDANVNFLAGMADAGLNDLKGAARHYERAVRANGKLVPAQRELAMTYLKLGNRPKAQSTLERLQRLDQDCAGRCEDAQAIKDAISAIQAALASAPQAQLGTQPPLLFASAAAGDHFYLEAVGLINEGRYEEAIVSLERARASFGAHPDILTYLGFAHRKLHRYGIAERYYREALAAAPTHKGATEYYGELMVERGDFAGARMMLARLDTICTFGCAEADELRRWIAAKSKPAS